MIFIGDHPGPLHQMAEYARLLSTKNHFQVEVVEYISLGKTPILKESDYVRYCDAHAPLEELFAKVDSLRAVVLDVSLQNAREVAEFARARGIKVYALYDNREAFVPGEYNQNVRALYESQVLDGWVFTSANLEGFKYELDGEIVTVGKKYLGKVHSIGYVNTDRIKQLRGLRKNKKELCTDYLNERGLQLSNPYIITCIGSASTPYLSSERDRLRNALKGALESCTKDDVVLVFQEHPRAPPQILSGEKAFVTTQDLEKHVAMSDLVLYYQTSVAGEIAAAKIPIVQIGRVRVHESLVASGKVASLNAVQIDDLAAIIDDPLSIMPMVTLKDLGWCEDYQARLVSFYEEGFAF